MEDSHAQQPSLLESLNWREHLGLIIGAATTVLIAAKILAVAGWDQNTALGILTASGTVNVLTGSFLRVLPQLAGVGASLLIPKLLWSLTRRGSGEKGAAFTWLVWVLIVTLTISPVLYVGLGIVVFSIPYLIRGAQRLFYWVSRQQRPRRLYRATGEVRTGRVEVFSVFLAPALSLLVTTLPSPWLPSEVMDEGSQAKTVYVLESTGNETTVLLDSGRTLERVASSRLKGRYCQSEDIWALESVAVMFKSEQYPICPK